MENYETEEVESTEKGKDLKKLVDSNNIAELLDDEELEEIGRMCHKGYEMDMRSRAEYDLLLDRWTKLALQISTNKTFPWPNASNVKFPLLSIASLQFSARAYPSLVPASGQVVKCRVIGDDPAGEKKQRADRVSKFMSWQIMDEMEEWEEEHDKLLTTLPIVGTMFKKTYWDNIKQRNVSCLLMPKELVVNYWAKSLDDVERITEVHEMSKRKIMEKVRSGIYKECDLGEPILYDFDQRDRRTDPSQMVRPNEVDSTTPYTILEQCCYLDLDEDEYEEPYIVTFDKNTQKVLRIVARFTMRDVKVDQDGTIVSIEPQQYYTKYGFIPNPDGGFYDVGFGRLLGTINDAVDTGINQLIDGGSMSALQAGFLAKGLRMKIGEGRFTPGEWKVVNATGQDLKNGVFPLPTRDPSNVLLNLVQFLVQSGKELASVAEIFTGKMPGQNTPATTTQATVEQGMKVFTSIYKRIFRSMQVEFRKIYKLNRTYLDPQTYIDVLDMQMPQSDFEADDKDIIPAADPQAVSAQEKQQKANATMQLLQLGTVDPIWATKQYFEAYEIPGAEQAIRQPPPPQPDPKEQIEIQKAQMGMQQAQASHQMKMAAGQQKQGLDAKRTQQKIQEQAILGRLKAQNAAQQGAIKTQSSAAQAGLKLRQSQQAHALKMRQQAQAAAAKARAKPSK